MIKKRFVVPAAIALIPVVFMAAFVLTHVGRGAPPLDSALAARQVVVTDVVKVSTKVRTMGDPSAERLSPGGEDLFSAAAQGSGRDLPQMSRPRNKRGSP